jgi:hypothetical protein
MNWGPNDVIRLAALIGSMVLFGVGAYMMFQGIGAEGAIDIKSSVVSGSLKTGSAGLFIVFLSFLVIVVVLLSPAKPRKEGTPYPRTSGGKASMVAKAFVVLLVSFVATGALAALGYGQGFAPVSMALGFMTFICGAAYFDVRD